MTLPEGQLPRIVVADDAQYMRDLIALLLRHQGFDAVGVAGGDAALETILAEGADGLVSDLCMPGLDGLSLARVLRALRTCAALPIVVFTGVEAEDPRLQALSGIDNLRVLSKPNGLRAIAPVLIEMLATELGGQRSGTADLVGTPGSPAQSMSVGLS
jgi:CheY-like chemotaxis protein